MSTWNLEAEFLSGIITCIILLYSLANRNEDNLKNRIFRYCIIITLITICLTISSTMMIFVGSSLFPNWLISLTTQLYFLFLPAIGQMYVFYIIATILEENNYNKKIFLLSAIPFLLYFVIVLFNPLTQWLFAIDTDGQYIQGPYIFLNYAFFYLTCITSIILVLLFRKNIPSYTAKILLMFPICAFGIIYVQNLFPETILTGTAAMFSLLISYLYLQNKKFHIDTLTDLQNRQAYTKRFASTPIYSQNHTITPFVISMNNFRAINDSFGQNVGDNLLIEIGRYLKTITPLEDLYRFSGDEFLIMNYDKNLEEAMDQAIQIQKRFEEPWITHNHEIMLSMSIGMVEYSKVKGTFKDLISALEYTVKTAKQNGNNQIICFNEEILNKLKRKNQITQILQDEIKKNGFEIFFQPIFSLKANRFVSAEALIRLKHEVLGYIPPFEFIPIAEKTGKINQIGYIVIEKTCAFIRDHMQNVEGFSGISVNLSILQIMEHDFVDNLLAIVKKYQISPALLKLEITETVLSNNIDFVKDVMKTLSKEGFLFSLDDFGTGYSNLSSLLQLPFDIIKIDRSLVIEAETSPKNSILLHSLITTFMEIGLDIVVEGVETTRQLNFIKHIKCDFIQGFYFAKPMPIHMALPYLKNELSAIKH